MFGPRPQDGKKHGTATSNQTGIASEEASLPKMRQDDESLANALQNLSPPSTSNEVAEQRWALGFRRYSDERGASFIGLN